MILSHQCIFKFLNCNFIKLKLSSPIVRTFKCYGNSNNLLKKVSLQIQGNFRNIHQKKSIGLGNLEHNFSFVDKDVNIYHHKNDRFFKYLSLFSVSQFIFWTYLSHVVYTTMRDTPVLEEEIEEVNKSYKTNRPKFISVGRKLNLGQYKDGISITCAAMGILSVVLSTLYTKNCARLITLKKGGESVILEFYTIFGKGRRETIPLAHLSANNSRQNAQTYLILKLKDRLFYVIVDMKGNFPNKELYDRTAGLRRTWLK